MSQFQDWEAPPAYVPSLAESMRQEFLNLPSESRWDECSYAFDFMRYEAALDDYVVDESSYTGPRIKTLIEITQIIANSTLDGHSLETSALQSKIASYGKELALTPFCVVALVILGLVTLYLVPTWISRCCAHRCCAPGPEGTSSKKKIRASMCCSLWWLLLLVCIGVGIWIMRKFQNASEALMCDLHASVLQTHSYLAPLNRTFAAVEAAHDNLALKVDSVNEKMLTINTSFLPNMQSACSALKSASTIAANVSAILLAEYGSMSGALSKAQNVSNSMCGWELTHYTTHIVERHSRIEFLSETLGEISKALNELPFDSYLSVNVDDVHLRLTAQLLWASRDVYVSSENVWLRRWLTRLQDSSVIYGWTIIPLLYFGALSCCVVAILGSACFAHQLRKSCAVQALGCSWVVLSCIQLFFAWCAFLILLTSLLMYDSGTVLLRAPRHPAFVLGEHFCESHRQASVYLNLDICKMAQQCWANPAVSPKYAEIFGKSEQGYFDLLTPQGLDARLAGANIGSGAPLDLEILSFWQGDISQLKSSVAQLNAASFGAANSSVAAIQIGSYLANLSKEVATAATSLASIVNSTSGLDADAHAVVVAAKAVKSKTVTLEYYFDTMINCAWMQPTYDRLIEPYLHGSLHDSVWQLGVTFLVAVAVCFGIVASSVACQVWFGEVGHEPGCIRRCRCCCGPVQKYNRSEWPSFSPSLVRQSTPEVVKVMPRRERGDKVAPWQVEPAIQDRIIVQHDGGCTFEKQASKLRDEQDADDALQEFYAFYNGDATDGAQREHGKPCAAQAQEEQPCQPSRANSSISKGAETYAIV